MNRTYYALKANKGGYIPVSTNRWLVVKDFNSSCIIQTFDAAQDMLDDCEYFKNNFHIVKIKIEEEAFEPSLAE